MRFGVPFIGSRALVGDAEALLSCTDRDGLTVGAALEAYGLDPDRIDEARASAQARRATSSSTSSRGPCSIGWALPLGVVETIAGQSRARADVHRPRQPCRHDTDGVAARRTGRGRGMGWRSWSTRPCPRRTGRDRRADGTPRPTSATPSTARSSPASTCAMKTTTCGRQAVDRLVEGAQAIAGRRGLAVSHTPPPRPGGRAHGASADRGTRARGRGDRTRRPSR